MTELGSLVSTQSLCTSMLESNLSCLTVGHGYTMLAIIAACDPLTDTPCAKDCSKPDCHRVNCFLRNVIGHSLCNLGFRAKNRIYLIVISYSLISFLFVCLQAHALTCGGRERVRA